MTSRKVVFGEGKSVTAVSSPRSSHPRAAQNKYYSISEEFLRSNQTLSSETGHVSDEIRVQIEGTPTSDVTHARGHSAAVSFPPLPRTAPPATPYNLQCASMTPKQLLNSYSKTEPLRFARPASVSETSSKQNHGRTRYQPLHELINTPPNNKTQSDKGDVAKGDLDSLSKDASVRKPLKHFNLTLTDSLGSGRSATLSLNYSAMASQRSITDDTMRSNMRKERLLQKQIARIENRLAVQRQRRQERARQLQLLETELAKTDSYGRTPVPYSTPRKPADSSLLLHKELEQVRSLSIKRHASAIPSYATYTRQSSGKSRKLDD